MTPTIAMVEATLDAFYGDHEWSLRGPPRAAYLRDSMHRALTAALAVSGYGEAVEALRGCVKAHETGRYEPVHIAYEVARAALARVTPESQP